MKLLIQKDIARRNGLRMRFLPFSLFVLFLIGTIGISPIVLISGLEGFKRDWLDTWRSFGKVWKWITEKEVLR